MIFLLQYWRIVAPIGGLLILLSGLAYWHHETYQSGVKAGRAEIQAKWDKDRAEIAALAAQVQAENAAKVAAALKENERIHDEYEARLAAANAGAMDFARRLRDAEIAAGSRAVPQAPGIPGPAPASPPPSSDRLDQLVADAAAECVSNAAQLDALIAEINPQIAR